MKDWTQTFSEKLWIKPDHTGAEDAGFIHNALRLRKGDAVLDAPCGAGRIAAHIARSGCLVTGIDLQKSFIRRARERFRNEGLKGQFAVSDLREMRFGDIFDAVYCWNGSFGFFGDSENLDVLKRYVRALRKGGRLLIDQPNREKMLRHFKPAWTKGALTTRNKWCTQTQRVESDWVVKRGRRREYNRMSIRLYTPNQLCSLFEQAGLCVEKIYGSITGESYRRGSARLIVVGRKKRSANRCLQGS